ncbi:hypothetical protein CVT25_001967 [Psilocybe cyanescens]|uniref:REJ domain-containing protein n=1 Tax=Psilocybe cyanescens TaxID=93625 RepID=A0A409WQR8_PSICY|nr:hypothetical protein CVT25_001967 [Psilocybe cyanescens]
MVANTTSTAPPEITTGSTSSEVSITSTVDPSSFSFSSVFSSSVVTEQVSSGIARNLSVSSTDSSRPVANPTVPILASSSFVSSIKASESTTRSRVVTVVSSFASVESSSMSTAAPLSSSIPVPISSKNNSPVISLADQTPINKSSSSHEAVSTSHTSSPVVSTKAASPSLSSTHSESPPAPPSSPVQPPAPTSSKPTSSNATPSSTSSHGVQTTTSGPLSQRTSTVTQPADTTLSSAIAITSTNSDGAKVVTTPALVTFMSTSTESNGALTTVTHVVANPPNLTGTQQLSSANGPLHKQGVLAGICVVVGVVAATIVIGLIFFIRRKRRLDRRRRWLAGMQQQRPSSLSGDPFRDPQESYQGPAMRSVGTARESHWDQSSSGSPLVMQEPLSHEQRNMFGGVSLVPDPYPAVHVINSPEQERYEYPHARLAYTTDSASPMAPFKRQSMTPSSPSIYPATLPPDDNEGHEAKDYIPEPVQQEPASPVSLSTVPPRPPRSHLRESAKIGRYGAPLTPPESNSSHNSQPPSPISEPNRPQEFFTRRTILDVRNR